MPLYEFECTRCGHLTEVLQRLSDPPLANCPQCEGPVRKLLSAPAFQFKGSGWYVTDYARKGKGDAKTGDGGKAEKAGGGDKTASGDGGAAKADKPGKPAGGSSSD